MLSNYDFFCARGDGQRVWGGGGTYLLREVFDAGGAFAVIADCIEGSMVAVESALKENLDCEG